ncbi:MAG: helix-turn-helix transcriptional regulator [archaeon GB-1867-035]|mgnify:CR=1 FL=1|nr:helix-turn-helix transcriptional regulator [Candidatus Culexmicrobium profundum]
MQSNRECLSFIERIIDTVSKKQALQIITIIGNHGKLRFIEIMRKLPGITPKALTSRLRELKAVGIVKRKVYPEIPPRAEYILTDEGYELREIMWTLMKCIVSKRGLKSKCELCLKSIK